jgi:putative sigma-54 modulation protein
MRLQVKGKNVEVSASVRQYAESKLSKLDRQLSAETQVEVELSEEKNPSISDGQVAEATVFAKGVTLRARESSRDIRASIDELVDNLERQVKRYQDKRRHERRRRTDHHNVE